MAQLPPWEADGERLGDRMGGARSVIERRRRPFRRGWTKKKPAQELLPVYTMGHETWEEGSCARVKG
jgi:hypothetical protein